MSELEDALRDCIAQSPEHLPARLDERGLGRVRAILMTAVDEGRAAQAVSELRDAWEAVRQKWGELFLEIGEQIGRLVAEVRDLLDAKLRAPASRFSPRPNQAWLKFTGT